MPPVSEQKFASFLLYSPRGKSEAATQSRKIVRDLKENKIVDSVSVDGRRLKLPMAEAIATRMAARRDTRPETPGLAEMLLVFEDSPVLVPVPRSSLMKRNTLWPSQCLTTALVNAGFGGASEAFLERVTPVRKSATADAVDRPSASVHYASMRCESTGTGRPVFVIVDDIVTRGAQILAAAGVLRAAWPNATIRAFAVVRTSSGSSEISIVAPCSGTITWNDDRPKRRP